MVNGSWLMVNGEGLIITLERSILRNPDGYSGPAFSASMSLGAFFIIIDGEW